MGALKVQTCYLVLFTLFLSSFVEAKQMLIGYYTYRSATSGTKVDEIPGELLTHVIYSFIKISDDGKCQVEPGDLNAKGEAIVLAQFGKLKKKYPKLHLMMAIGGWGGSGKFSEIAASEKSRRTFVNSCVELVKKYGLDGVDIDWEYPVTGGLPTDLKSPDDPKNFVLLVKDLREQLGASKVLSAAVAAYGEATINLDVVAMTRYVDWLGIMAYDFSGPWSETTAHHAALFASPSSKKSAKLSVDAYLAQGAKPEKLVLGVPFYAHSWAEVQPQNNGLAQKFKGVPPTRLGDGGLNYAEVQRDFVPTSTRYFDADAKVPWLYDAKRKIMVSYEDPESIKLKAEYVRKTGLGGVMFWELNHDGEKRELLKTLFDGL